MSSPDAERPAELEGPTGDGQAGSPEPNGPALTVGVGASAGGLEAFKELLEHIPADAGITFLYVQHLQADQPSLLLDILRHSTPLEVREAEEGLRLEPNHVYVIPRGADMAVKNDCLTLVPRPGKRVPHMPVDHLFRSLAEDQNSRAIGVVLSGGGTDGTLGLKAIKTEDGITFAQDEKTARHHSMPRAAVAEGAADHVLPPAEIARQLLRIARHPYPSQPEPPAVAPEEDGGIDKIIQLLRARTDMDFSHYKRNTIVRRVRRRMALRGYEHLQEYLHHLEERPAELQELYQDFLIRVTRFFRDEEVFEALKGLVYPALIKDRSANSAIRLWVAGCSTGEEVYSLAMALMEFLGERSLSVPIKILATDVNEAALEKARAGVYVENIELDVSPERLRRFFAKVNGHYQVGKVIRDMCVFSKHNLTNDPPFSRLDLVSCRNLLIYLDAPLQKRVLPLLHYALNPGGFLLLGSSETVGSLDLFTAVDTKHRIYSKNAASHIALPLDFGVHVGTAEVGRRLAAGPTPWSALDVQKEADRAVLAKYAPVGVVIDENMTVLQFRGRTGPYLEPAPGMASLDLLKMLREGLLSEVRAAISQAKAEGMAVRRGGIPMRDKDGFRQINVEVLPIKVPPGGVRCYVVLFHDTPLAPPPERGRAAAAPLAESTEPAPGQEVAQLKQELAATREYLQSLIEEHESACEELKSASEELLSSNEELQSTNEELQTAKEETQSANEELATLNEELHHRNFDLGQANNDLVNLLGAVQIPIVLVGRDLRLRRFTPLAESLLNLIPTDVGRPISDIKSNLNVPDLAERIARVIDSLTPQEAEVQDKDGRYYSLRIRPYVTLDNKIDGASITLVDIDRIKREVEQQKQAGDGGSE
jgi:two-component system CheB/CheR fusion protein